MFLLSHVLGPPLGLSVPVALYVFDPTPEYDILILLGSILAFWIFPFLLRTRMSYRRLVTLSILNLNFAILWSCFHYGGVHSPTVTWVLIIPILTVFYIGGQSGQKASLLIACSLSFTTFALAYLTLAPGPNDIPQAAMEILGATSAVAVMCYIAGMAIYYARVFDAGVELESEVAHRRLLAIELRHAVEAANAAVSAKSEFLARMSHELRSPLNAIIGYGELLQEDSKEDPDHLLGQDLDRILEAGHYLTRLIDMILDLAKIELGKMTFDARSCDVCALITATAERQRALIEATGNTLSVDVPAGAFTATLDANRFGQILDSIVTNAAKFTQGGRIDIALRPAGTECESFEVSVQDTGCGIADEVLPTLFENFLMDRHAAESRYGGTGLALSVTSKLCAAMGGRIAAQSVLGEGSTFTITLPIVAQTSAVARSAPECVGSSLAARVRGLPPVCVAACGGPVVLGCQGWSLLQVGACEHVLHQIAGLGAEHGMGEGAGHGAGDEAEL